METIKTANIHLRKDFEMLQKKFAWCCSNANKYFTPLFWEAEYFCTKHYVFSDCYHVRNVDSVTCRVVPHMDLNVLLQSLKKQSISCKGCQHKDFHLYECDNVSSALSIIKSLSYVQLLIMNTYFVCMTFISCSHIFFIKGSLSCC